MELIKRRGTLVVVSAPSGAGKTTLCHEVRQLVPDLFYSVSYTTRLPRAGEVDGKDFHFVSEAEFLDMRDKDEFAEWAEVHGHRYGTPVKALEGALGRGLDVLLDIDTHGARQLRQRYPEAVSVFVMAPSMKELEARLRERVQSLLADASLDEGRIATEVAVWAEKTDIADELTRLRAHLLQFALLLREGGTVGRTLDFLIQEMNREVNTVGAKADDLEVSQAVIADTGVLERLREQAQNIECWH